MNSGDAASVFTTPASDDSCPSDHLWQTPTSKVTEPTWGDADWELTPEAQSAEPPQRQQQHQPEVQSLPPPQPVSPEPEPCVPAPDNVRASDVAAEASSHGCQENGIVAGSNGNVNGNSSACSGSSKPVVNGASNGEADEAGNLVMNLPSDEEETSVKSEATTAGPTTVKPEPERTSALLGDKSHEQQDSLVGAPPAKKPMTKPSKAPKGGDSAPAMHAIRISANGFRQRWNGQQWRRLCDDPSCPREAQRLSRCAKHQPVKEWRPARRSRGSSSSAKPAPSPKMAMHHPADFHHPLPMLSANTPHPMPLSDPMLFPGEVPGLNVSPSPVSEAQQDDSTPPPPVQWWPSAIGTMAGFAVPYSTPSYTQQPPGYSYENLAMMYNSMPNNLEPLVPTWSVPPQSSFNPLQ